MRVSDRQVIIIRHLIESYLYMHICLRHKTRNYLRPNTPLQIVTSPISLRCFWCFCRAKGLVNTSAVCSGSRQLSILITLSCTRSRTQCHLVAICLDLLWNWGLRAIAIRLNQIPSQSWEGLITRYRFYQGSVSFLVMNLYCQIQWLLGPTY